MAVQAQTHSNQIHYGHNDTHVLLSFDQPMSIAFLTVEQAESVRAGLAEAITALKAHQASKARRG